jgi:hypothetical protein
MGFLKALFGGGGKKLEVPAADRIFAMTTANITLDASFGIKSLPKAGIVFQQLGTADFKQVLKDTEELLRGAAQDTGTQVMSKTDEFGYGWVVLEDPDFDDLVTSINVVSTELQAGGYGDRLLAAVFGFEEDGRPLYFIYNFKRGKYYPFVPGPGDKTRNNEREFQLKAQMDGELPIEPELERWFPLWDIPL